MGKRKAKATKRPRGGEGSRLVSVVESAMAVRGVLRRGPVTVAELAVEADLPLRQAYRILRALQGAGLPVEELPGTKVPQGGGKAPRLYRLRERGVGVVA